MWAAPLEGPGLHEVTVSGHQHPLFPAADMLGRTASSPRGGVSSGRQTVPFPSELCAKSDLPVFVRYRTAARRN